MAWTISYEILKIVLHSCFISLKCQKWGTIKPKRWIFFISSFLWSHKIIGDLESVARIHTDGVDYSTWKIWKSSWIPIFWSENAKKWGTGVPNRWLLFIRSLFMVRKILGDTESVTQIHANGMDYVNYFFVLKRQK